jgi:VanZ family protein
MLICLYDLMLKFFLKYYLPVIIVAGTIFYFSGIPGLRYGSESTTREIILRKGAHFVEYAILSFFLWRVFWKGKKMSARRSFWWSFILATLYGVSDEFHQTFVFARTGKVIDALFDSLSALFVLELLFVFAKRKMKWQNALVIVFSMLSLLGLGIFMIEENNRTSERMLSEKRISEDESKTYPTNDLPETEIFLEENAFEEDNSEKEDEAAPSIEEEIPAKFMLSVPFTSQAPFAKWDHRHQEACEEASLLMLKYFLDKKSLTPEIAEREIQKLIDFQIKEYGFFEDTTAEETARLGKEYYGIQNMRVVYDFSQEDLKRHLLRGAPIIVPAAGQMLGNPNFSGEGPPYHMLLVVGYDGKFIITNDPGTRRGEGYRYSEDIFFEAIRDFTGDKKTIKKGRKAMIVVE